MDQLQQAVRECMQHQALLAVLPDYFCGSCRKWGGANCAHCTEPSSESELDSGSDGGSGDQGAGDGDESISKKAMAAAVALLGPRPPEAPAAPAGNKCHMGPGWQEREKVMGKRLPLVLEAMGMDGKPRARC
jgi:hypothetical protein